MKMFNEGSSRVWLSEPMVSGGNGTYFILRSVSRTYYDFRKSWLLHKRTQNQGAFDKDPLATLLIGNPTSVISNVTNGYGILAAYVQDFIKVDVKQWKLMLSVPYSSSRVVFLHGMVAASPHCSMCA